MDAYIANMATTTTVTRWLLPICIRHWTVVWWGRALIAGLLLVTVGDVMVAAASDVSNDLSWSAIAPPQPMLVWDHSAEDILRLTEKAIAQHTVQVDKIGALAPQDCNFTSVFLPLASADSLAESNVSPLLFYRNVSPNKTIRNAANQAYTSFGNYNVETSMRLDIYQAKIHAEKNIRAFGQWDKLSAEDKRLVKQMITEGQRSGLALPEKERVELTSLHKKLSKVCLEFNQNINEENGVVSFTEDELKGVPRDVILGYKLRKEGSRQLYDVTFRKPDITPLLSFAENPETRKRAQEAADARLAVNVPLLDIAMELRRKIAKLLHYDSWADYVTEVRMIKNARSVAYFLDNLESKLHPVGLRELNILLGLKKDEHKEKGYPYDGQLYAWDADYYGRKYAEKTLRLNHTLVMEYFPVSTVIPAILRIYENLLGVRFEENNGTATWHPDVKLFSVWTKVSAGQWGFLGYCYLDLFSRESKYSHTAVWPLLYGYNRLDGTLSYPVSAIVANFAKPNPEKPALMRHQDVVTFFHEMGHIFHTLLSRTQYGRFHASRVARDFIEAPSQMLENWCWEPEVLKLISSHYRTKEPLPVDLVDSIINSRYANVGLFYLSQVFLAKFDQKLHTEQGSINSTEVWNALRDRIILLKYSGPGTRHGAFGHIMAGYDASVYGYMYSRVFASDLYATIFKANPLDPVLGAKYVATILRPGSSRDELDSVQEFLGRPPNYDAFIKDLFGTVS